MRKFLITSFIIMSVCSAWAGNSWIAGDGCMITYTPSPDWIAWCGGAKEKCDGTKAKRRKQTFINDGGLWSVSHDRNGNYVWYACCSGQFKTFDTSLFTSDQLVDQAKPQRTETITIELAGGGKCTYKAKYNACGTELTKPCSEPTVCNDGLILRNGECAEPCAEGQEFESETSKKCVDCETTLYQGPVKSSSEDDLKNALKKAKIFVKSDGTDDEDKVTKAVKIQIEQYYCKKCDKNTEFFNTETSTCVKRTAMDLSTNQAMAKCGLCSAEKIKECIQCYSKIGTYADAADDTCKATFEDDCFFQE